MTSYTYSNLPITVTCQQRHYSLSPGSKHPMSKHSPILYLSREKLGGHVLGRSVATQVMMERKFLAQLSFMKRNCWSPSSSTLVRRVQQGLLLLLFSVRSVALVSFLRISVVSEAKMCVCQCVVNG